MAETKVVGWLPVVLHYTYATIIAANVNQSRRHTEWHRGFTDGDTVF
jgi:hypothetical protein